MILLSSMRQVVRSIGQVPDDVRYAVRGLHRSPAFAIVAILTLAIGIGATAAIFSVVNTVMLKPLPYRDADRIVRLMMNVPASESRTGTPLRTAVAMSAAEVAALQSRSRLLSHAGTVAPTLMGLSGGYEEGARLQGSRVSSSLLNLLVARPQLGRVFGTADEAPGHASVILLSDVLWRRYFGADPAIVGRTIRLQSVLGPRRETEHTVIGVMPPDFQFPDSRTMFWMPFEAGGSGGSPMRGPLVARLGDGASSEAAVAEIGPVVRELRQHTPSVTYELVSEQQELAAPVKPALFVLTGAAGFLLLIACVNVANLLLARASRRDRDAAIRAAIGAGRSRLVQQALVESLTLSIAGACAGLVVATGGIRLLRTLATTLARVDLGTGPLFPRLDEIQLDATVLVITVAIAVAAGLLFGLAPALRYARADLMDALKRGDAPVSGGGRRFALRDVLVVVQIGLATMLLIGGGLLARSFVRLTNVDRGYDASNVLTFQVALPAAAYPDERLKTFAEDTVARIQAIPGVRTAGYANQLPMVQLRDTFAVSGLTRDPLRTAATHGADARQISRDYLKAMGIRVVAGRGFEERDRAGAQKVVVVNESLARREFPNGDAVGKPLYIGAGSEPWQVVGVVQDVRQLRLDREAQSQFFVDLRQAVGTGPLFPIGPYFVVRTDGKNVLPHVRQAVRDLDPQAALFNVTPMEEIVAATVARPRMHTVLMSIFAAVGTVLAVIGIYGVMAYTVERRTRELGIRIAIGASHAYVIRLVLGRSSLLTALGLISGLGGALALTRYLEGMLFEITAFEPVTFAAVCAVFAGVSTAAALIPARRAVSVDPVAALRAE